jgi:twitching motility protein PilT
MRRMQTLALDADLLPRVVSALGNSPLFSAIQRDVLERVAERGVLLQLDAEEVLVEHSTPSDSFAVLLLGELSVNVPSKETGDLIEVSKLLPPESVGEMGLLLDKPRTATVKAKTRSLLMRFDRDSFFVLYDRVPGFGRAISAALAARLATASRQIPMPVLDEVVLDPEVIALVPVELLARHRIVPVKQEGNRVLLGFVDDASARVLEVIRSLLPGMDVVPVRISVDVFERALGSHAGVAGWTADPLRDTSDDASDDVAIPAPFSSADSVDAPSSPPAARAAPVNASANAKKSPRLDALLRRMVAEGCSDVHLSGGQKPRWRLDGEMQVIADAPVLGVDEVRDLLWPVMDERAKRLFDDENDADFAYAIDGVARFRVNLFRDRGGSGAVLRQIPAKILTFEQLGLPAVIARMCENPKGLVLVTGPTGSGKSTTLAAMIDAINKTRRSHIITLEDPIEFVHKSELSLVNQREVFAHTKSFARALKAALREDPDIVLVGEMRDLETISLALETANTGHLVFGTLHTSTAISTVDRIIDVFPPAQQAQVRAVLADTLKGVVSQALCKKVGGGRAAALETLIVNYAIANLIREGKTHQVVSAMTTSKALGNTLLNESLAALVNDGKVDYAEGLSKAVDKADLARRCGKPSPSATAAA